MALHVFVPEIWKHDINVIISWNYWLVINFLFFIIFNSRSDSRAVTIVNLSWSAKRTKKIINACIIIKVIIK